MRADIPCGKRPHSQTGGFEREPGVRPRCHAEEMMANNLLTKADPRDHFSRIARKWSHVGPPLRPSASDTAAMQRAHREPRGVGARRRAGAYPGNHWL